MSNTIGTLDRETPLSDLRDILDWHVNQNDLINLIDNIASLVMVLCQRVEALESRIAQLEVEETTNYCQNCGDAPHRTIRRCCNCGQEHEEVTR